ncbi:N-methylhydantoinase B [Pseudonocardia sulfidoxydans NBRC 16205]|uniref:N-methylhydantoinase B n=1 Tax=Pseudonocardia sulfidoxydans NBRC 16205 TaxID=1223511 RepID=A0A511DBR4_9PSEU|nr:hydantoinase B/oxoprolinase family protein [Pseudonocardia sulfidoxydans]GEL22249.1 N-methylhydantoinase B [Pseudonocardia sulfidoxydans NBRC 16205]
MTLDGLQLAVLSSRMEQVVRAMANTLARTARSGVINTARDFSCCVLTGDAELVATAESLPVHVMRGPDIMAAYTARMHPDLRRGDAYLHNSPYHGNSHAADHCILVPVVDPDGTHRFTVLVKAHQADCGNGTPTTYSTSAADVYEEGALIFPAVRVQRDFTDVDDVIRMCRMRIRVPDQWWGDYLAMVGAARIGEREVERLAADVGWDALEQYAGEWFDFSEQRVAEAIAELPAGRVTLDGAHDPFPGVPGGVPVSVTVDVDPVGGRVVVDLRDNPDCQPCGLNLTESTSASSALVGVFNSLPASVPANAGSLRRVEVLLRENCVVGIPRHPASCSVATTNVADRVTNLVQRAIAELGPGVGMAEAGLVQPPAWAVISGADPRTGVPFVNQILFPGVTGGPGTPWTDGWLTFGHAGNAGMMLRDSVEIDEIHHPIRVTQQRILPDTEGAGEFRGAPGALVEYGPTTAPLTLSYGSDGAVHPARGAGGGTAGAPARQQLRRVDGSLVDLPPSGLVQLLPGETVVSESCGGGGYGAPHRRDPATVAHDVAEGWITPARAREVYAVAVVAGRIDEAETDRLRDDVQRGDR